MTYVMYEDAYYCAGCDEQRTDRLKVEAEDRLRREGKLPWIGVSP